ncbi:MAG: ECF transporter S component [Candidatus Bathyarchaeota archaeon]|nr:ECF transporter S component [Candidatus Termiticorpusculum sp.]
MQPNKTTTKKRSPSTFQLATAVILAALVAVATLAFVFFIPATSGYFNLGDVIIYAAALLFGPFVGLIAGAGASIADILIAPVYAPATLIIKATEGFLVGYLIKKLNKKIKSLTLCASIAVLIGGSEMVAGYFIYDTLIAGYSFALVAVPFNVVQMLVGLIIAVPVMHAVLRVFPQLKSYL